MFYVIQSICLFTYLFIYLFIYSPIYLYAYFYTFIYLFIYLFTYSFLPGFGSIDFELFSNYYVSLGPLAEPYTLPFVENDEDITLGDTMTSGNDNDQNNYKTNEKTVNQLSSRKNSELILLTKCYVSVIILFICFILLIRTIRKCCTENHPAAKRIGEYEILYTDSNLNDFSELRCVHKKTEIVEESKKTELGFYGSMSTYINNPSTREYLIQSDKKTNVLRK